MKILTAKQIHRTDAATIEHEPIASIDLMERAARAFTKAFVRVFPDQRQPVMVFAGPGNNGGDALAVARLLHEQHYAVRAFTVNTKDEFSPDCQTNLDRLSKLITVYAIRTEDDKPEIPENAVIIDGLFGSGLSRPATGLFARVIDHINASQASVAAIDIPSGLFCDEPVPDAQAAIICARYTFTFQLPKRCFFLPQNGVHTGHWQVIDIGLNQYFIDDTYTDYFYVEENMVKPLIKKRQKFSHKGTYGKAMLIAGGYGKMGAAILCSRACLRTGVGLLTVHVPECGYQIIQTAVPEAMALVDDDARYFSRLGKDKASDLSGYDVVGVGPGISTEEKTASAVADLLREAKKHNQPMVLDADVLNICGKHKFLLNLIPPRSILTPHPIEFERITEKPNDDFHRLELAREFTQRHNVYIVLKGAFTATVTPEGKVYFNSTGNPGMATGGSGDVLTGIITSLLAQDYVPLHAAMFGVYLHGLAGDLAAAKVGEEALIASDIIDHIGEAYRAIQQED